jgi:rhamnosyltransferase
MYDSNRNLGALLSVYTINKIKLSGVHIMKTVTVLLSTYYGEKYLQEQLDSLINQCSIRINIIVRDDGSKDLTTYILTQYEAKGILSWYQGENIGSTNSFMDLIYNAPESDYYALCDQDDVWDSDKLKVAVDYLEEVDKEKAALYSCNTRLVDANLNFLKIENKKPLLTFGSSLVKNYATGCTIVFNRKLLELIKIYKPRKISDHDWWINNVCLATGGVSIFDNKAHIMYRQHGKNVIGSSAKKWGKIVYRVKKFFRDRSHTRVNFAYELLEGYKQLMGQTEIEITNLFYNYRCNIGSMIGLLRCKYIRTANKLDNILFFIYVIFKRA